MMMMNANMEIMISECIHGDVRDLEDWDKTVFLMSRTSVLDQIDYVFFIAKKAPVPLVPDVVEK